MNLKEKNKLYLLYQGYLTYFTNLIISKINDLNIYKYVIIFVK